MTPDFNGGFLHFVMAAGDFLLTFVKEGFFVDLLYLLGIDLLFVK